MIEEITKFRCIDDSVSNFRVFDFYEVPRSFVREVAVAAVAATTARTAAAAKRGPA